MFIFKKKRMSIYSYENGRNIKNVMIAGKIILQDGEFTTIDEKSVLAELRSLHTEFMENYKKILPLSDEMFKYIDVSYRKCVNADDNLWRFSASKEEYKSF